ncbi:MAG: BadF/BadG/BcrA/BcrD ATPase family protein [Candidatus Neomarinimicrobiota bacterium]
MAADHWFLSIDGGGTKTDALLFHAEEFEGFRITGEGTNPNVYGESGIEALADLIFEAAKAASIQAGVVSGCVVGMAGISNPRYRTQIEDRLSETLPRATLKLTSDAELAHRNIWGNARGMTLIVGTGSIALGTDSRGNIRRSGGFGFQAGDEGSGYWLGKMLLAELIASERSTVDDILELRDQVVEIAGRKTFEDAVAFFSGVLESVARVAELGPIVLSFAEKRNLVASQIVSQGAEALASLIEDLWEKLELTGSETEIGISGSIIVESAFYRDVLKNQLPVELDSLRWVKSDFPPVYGGLLLSDLHISPEDYPRITIQHV